MRPPLLSFVLLMAATPALAADKSQELRACRSYGELAFYTFQDRDNGITQKDQLDKWKQIPTRFSNRDYYITRANQVLQYAYGPGAKMTPEEARTAFFRGCREASSGAAGSGNRTAPKPAVEKPAGTSD